MRMASIGCLAVWAVIWLLFLVMRLSTLDIRGFPGIGFVMLGAFAVAVLAPIVAAALAGIALVRQARVPRNWLLFGCAIAALLGQGLLFLITRWL